MIRFIPEEHTFLTFLFSFFSFITHVYLSINKKKKFIENINEIL